VVEGVISEWHGDLRGTVQDPEEATIGDSVLIIGIVVAALALFRSALRPMIVYVPLEVVEECGGLGCLPLLIVAALMLLALGVIRF
jgi:hypothetical protein